MVQILYCDLAPVSNLGFLRLDQIVRPSKKKTESGCLPNNYLLPISRSTWWRMVNAGDAPRPIKLSIGVTVWRTTDIHQWLFNHQVTLEAQ